LTLLANTMATGAVLVALIVAFGPVSGAHFNPAVTLAEAWLGRARWRHVPSYLAVQCAGGLAGTAVAHAMFGLPAFTASQHARSGPAQWFAEFVATFGLLAVIIGSSRTRSGLGPFVVAGWIVAAYWFTASTSFANPAVTLARSASDTFAGIRPVDAPAFVAAQLLGAFAGAGLGRWLWSAAPASEARP
jgi:glycerol uptake facilitator-like aquaporin